MELTNLLRVGKGGAHSPTHSIIPINDHIEIVSLMS